MSWCVLENGRYNLPVRYVARRVLILYKEAVCRRHSVTLERGELTRMHMVAFSKRRMASCVIHGTRAYEGIPLCTHVCLACESRMSDRATI